jgi:hypothetical protein
MGFGGLALVVTLGLAVGASANDEPRARALLVDEAPILDGVLDDPIWQKAEVISDFTQVEPIEGAPPSFRTEVRFLTNNESLFIAFRAFDPEPDKIVANLMGRDEFLFFDDNFTMVFDTFHDHRNGSPRPRSTSRAGWPRSRSPSEPSPSNPAATSGAST